MLWSEVYNNNNNNNNNNNIIYVLYGIQRLGEIWQTRYRNAVIAEKKPSDTGTETSHRLNSTASRQARSFELNVMGVSTVKWEIVYSSAEETKQHYRDLYLYQALVG